MLRDIVSFNEHARQLIKDAGAADSQSLRELLESLGPRDLESLAAFAEFLKSRRAARGFVHHHEQHMHERTDSPLTTGPVALSSRSELTAASEGSAEAAPPAASARSSAGTS